MTSEPTTDAELESLVGRIADEFAERYARGERPQIEEYVLRHPEAGAALREVLATAEAMCLLSHADSKTGPDDSRTIPETLGDFRIVREIAHGGMGIVYEAEQVSLNRRVALKVLPFTALLDERQLQRFRIEAQAAACLHHTHIVPVHAVGRDGNTHFYAMQYIDGQSLAQVLAGLRKTRGPTLAHEAQTDAFSANTAAVASPAVLTQPATDSPAWFRQVASWGIDAAEALDYAHKQGIVHRDVKPGNLLIDGAGELWITDFGLARRAGDANLTRTGDMIGTLRYMSPEQVLSQRPLIDHRSDIYALGATLYELLTLQPLFGGSDAGYLIRQITNEEPRSPARLNKALPKDLETIVLKAIDKDPGKRYATAQFLADDLRRFLDDKPVAAKRPQFHERLVKWSKRNKLSVAIAGVAFAAILLVTALAAGSIGWLANDRSVRHRALRQGATEALVEADNWQREGRVIEALAAVKRIEATLTGSGTAEFEEKIHRRRVDLELVARLDGVLLMRGKDPLDPGLFADYSKMDSQFCDAFREYGIEFETDSAQSIAAQITSSSVPTELAAAVDQWADTKTLIEKNDSAARLRSIASMVDSDPWRERARAAVRARNAAAIEDVADSDAALQQPPLTVLLLARGLINTGSRQRAETFLRSAQRLHPSDFWINATLANLLNDPRSGLYDDAVRFYTAALAVRPQIVELHYFLSGAFEGQGKLDEAVAILRRTIELTPNHTPALNNLGAFLSKQGNLDEAVVIFRKAVDLEPGTAKFHFNLGTAFLDKGRLDEAIAEIRKAIELQPDRADHYRNLTTALLRNGMLDETIAAAHVALQLKPDYAEVYVNLGAALARQGKLDESIGATRKAVEIKPSNAAFRNLGIALSTQGNLDEAISAFRQALVLNPEDVTSQNNLKAAEQVPQLEGRLSRFLGGGELPASTTEQLELAQFALVQKHLYATGARLYRVSIATDPRLANDVSTGQRYNAACAAALAGTTSGPENVNDEERSAWRSQAVQWLASDLKELKLRAETAPLKPGLDFPRNFPDPSKWLSHWLQDADLAGIRDPERLKALPKAEREKFDALWRDVTTFLQTLANAPRQATDATDVDFPNP